MKNPPAFPFAWQSPITGKTTVNQGMTLRDYFAAQALPICYEYWMKDYYHPDYPDAEDRNAEGREDFGGNTMNLIAEYSYSLADYMMRAREE